MPVYPKRLRRSVRNDETHASRIVTLRDKWPEVPMDVIRRCALFWNPTMTDETAYDTVILPMWNMFRLAASHEGGPESVTAEVNRQNLRLLAAAEGGLDSTEFLRAARVVLSMVTLVETVLHTTVSQNTVLPTTVAENM